MTTNIAKIRAVLESAKTVAQEFGDFRFEREADEAIAALAELEKAAAEPAVFRYEFLSHSGWHASYIETRPHDAPYVRNITPLYAARADARIAGLYEENVQLRDSVTIRDTEIARLETDLELARRDAARYRYVRMMNPREFSAMWTRTMVTCAQFDELIDKARAGNGGEG